METIVEKLEIQELGLDPSKTYIVNIHFNKDKPVSIELKGRVYDWWAGQFERLGFSNIIINPDAELCTVDIKGVSEE